MSKTALFPLESNPDVMNKYLNKLGVPAEWNVVDVMGLDSELLAFVPQPVLAVLLCFPISEVYEKHREEEEKKLSTEGQEIPKSVFYLKQTIANACGTVALVHAIANNADRIILTSGWMKKFIEDGKDLDPMARATLLAESDELINTHSELALEGQTEPTSENVNHHFVTFVHVAGNLYELDGRKAFPIDHGKTAPANFLQDAAKVCKQFMARDPAEVRFTVVALAAAQ